MVISEVLQNPGGEVGGTWTGRLLLEEGVDLLKADVAEMTRGTPVYVNADADVNDVQRQMALKHIKLLPVLKDGEIIGLVDLMDLVRMQARALEEGAPDVPLGRPA
ncbi:MAG: CBS domain-containing protein [Actinomycetota bacterium]